MIGSRRIKKANKERISIYSFDDHPIDCAWFMRELSTASISYSVFDDGDPHLADSLIEMITDVNIIDNIGEEQMRHFKNYFSLAPFLAKEGKHCL